MRGGIKYTTNNPVMGVNPITNAPMIEGYVEKNHSTRAIKNITNEVKLNEYMFDTASEYLQAA